MLFSSKSTRCVRNSVCVSVRQRVSKPIAEHSMGVGVELQSRNTIFCMYFYGELN